MALRRVYSKLPQSLKGEHNVATGHWVIWASLLSIGKYINLLERKGPLVGYIRDGKKKVWFVHYGFINDNSVWKN